MEARTPYRLSLAPTLERFRPEIEHACAFLERCHPLVRTNDAARVLHYGPDAPTSAVAVPAVLFPDGVRVDAYGIHMNHAAFAAIERGRGRASFLPPARTQDRRHADGPNYDALGLIFFILSRVEERDAPTLDRYGRFPYEASLAARHYGAAPPLADEAAHDLAAALLDYDDPPLASRYELLLTHDVDMLSGHHRPLDPLRGAAGDILKRFNPACAVGRLMDGYLSGEPWGTVRAIMAQSEAHGATSRFYFMGPSDYPMDSPYALRSPGLLRRVADEMAARGHVVGYHPCFATAHDAGEWQRQRDGLERVLGRQVREGRQHVLRYTADVTPDIWSDSGMTLDLTLGWPEVTGFRSGTCRRHAAYSLRRRRTLPLEQISTPIMDFGLFGGKYRNLSVDAALADCRGAVDACRRFGGSLVVLFHTGQRRPPVTSFYERLLAAIT
ncbi:MAG: DUF7033 domain-containing protein [Alphaproteobacteria bacterium]